MLLAELRERKAELDPMVSDDLKKATEELADQYERALKELAKR